MSTRTFEIDGTAHAALTFQRPLSLLMLPRSVAAYERAIGSKAMNMVRKARRAGYAAGPVDACAHLADIFAIRNSAPVRRGYPIPAYWQEPARPPIGTAGLCARHTELLFGVMRDDRLTAYCSLRVYGEIAQVNHFLGHHDRLPDGIMNLLVWSMVEGVLAGHPAVRAINYLYPSEGSLGLFKRTVGFRAVRTLTVEAPPAVARAIERATAEADPDLPEAVEQPPRRVPRAKTRTAIEDGRLWPDGPFAGAGGPSPRAAVVGALGLSSRCRALYVGPSGARGRDAAALLQPATVQTATALPTPEAAAGDVDLLWIEPSPNDLPRLLGKGLAAASAVLRPRGWLVIRLPWWPARAADSGALDGERAETLADLFRRRFRAVRLEPAVLDRGFRGSDFQFRGLLDAAGDEAASVGDGFLVLRKVRWPADADLPRLDEREAPAGTRLALPWILSQLGLGDASRVLDVGSGGFVGKTTVVPLRALGARVLALEIHPERAEALRQAFPDVEVVCGDIRTFDWSRGPFDLVMFDLDTGLTPLVMTELIATAHPHLLPGGHVVSMIVYDIAETYDGEKPLLGAAGKPKQAAFLRDFYGTERVDVAAAARAVAPLGYRVLGIVDKYLGAGRRGVGWLVLRKAP